MLAFLTTALGGCWFIEQPSGSVLEAYPVLLELLRTHYDATEFHAVTRTCWWMGQSSAPGA